MEYECAVTTTNRPYNYFLLLLCDVALQDYNPEADCNGSTASEESETSTDSSDEEEIDGDGCFNDESPSDTENVTHRWKWLQLGTNQEIYP